jgi:hypothetical protein
MGGKAQCDIKLAREVAVVEFLAINNDLWSTEVLVTLPIKYIRNGAWLGMIAVTIAKLFDLLGVHEEPLETRDEREVAEGPGENAATAAAPIPIYD